MVIKHAATMHYGSSFNKTVLSACILFLYCTQSFVFMYFILLYFFRSLFSDSCWINFTEVELNYSIRTCFRMSVFHLMSTFILQHFILISFLNFLISDKFSLGLSLHPWLLILVSFLYTQSPFSPSPMPLPISKGNHVQNMIAN